MALTRDCLDLCVFQWSQCFGGGVLELVSDPGVMMCASQSGAIPSVPSVQGRLKNNMKRLAQ